MLLVTECTGYKPLYSGDKSNFSIGKIDYESDDPGIAKKIGKGLKNIIRSEDNSEKINIIISLKKDKKTDQLYVFFGKSKFSLSTLPVDDFPEMDDENLEISLEVDSKELSNLIDKCKFCMGVDESRQYLNGIYLHQSGEVISTVATDGHLSLIHI